MHRATTTLINTCIMLNIMLLHHYHPHCTPLCPRGVSEHSSQAKRCGRYCDRGSDKQPHVVNGNHCQCCITRQRLCSSPKPVRRRYHHCVMSCHGLCKRSLNLVFTYISVVGVSNLISSRNCFAEYCTIVCDSFVGRVVEINFNS